MYRTTLHLRKRTAYRWLSLLLLVVLSLQLSSPLPLQNREGWDEALVPWPSRRCSLRRRHVRVCLRFLKRRGQVLLCRLGLVAVLLVWSGRAQRQPPCWAVLGLPLADALLSVLPLWRPRLLKVRAYPHLVRGTHELYQLTLAVSFCERLSSQGDTVQWMALGGCLEAADGAWARGEIEDDGTWRPKMEGQCIFRYKPRNSFEERASLVFFRQFRTPQSTPRRPFLRQEWLAEWFDTHQESISRWEGYVHRDGLQKLSGEYDGWVLTPQMRTAIWNIWVPSFWLSAAQVRERLLAEGHISSLKDISEKSIHQTARESGFAEVRRLLRQTFEFTADGPRWREEVSVNRLFELDEVLMARVQAGEGLTPQLTLEVESLKQALGAPITPSKKVLPFAYRLQRALFGRWEEIDDGSVHCPHCGSIQVSRKENEPRHKKYRCLDPACPFSTFTDYPEGVRLYSSWTVETMIWGVMTYVHLRTTHRRAADVVGVSHVTLWRWASQVGARALPVATLFGVVRSSGVVGIDEKWVLVPKNDEPQGKRQRWMYVYLAVDVFTYDLLHIDIYPYHGKHEARAFLQALEAKGYRPRAIVTDTNRDYEEPIRAVFPRAVHHECVFHALQWAQKLVEGVYGND